MLVEEDDADDDDAAGVRGPASEKWSSIVVAPHHHHAPPSCFVELGMGQRRIERDEDDGQREEPTIVQGQRFFGDNKTSRAA